MKKITLSLILIFFIAEPHFAQVDMEINGNILIETTGGLSIQVSGNIIENGTAYYKGTIESSPLSGVTEFAGLIFSSGFTGTITRVTGSSYAKGNGEGTNFKRYYEINNTGSAESYNLTVETETSGTNDESNSLTGPFFLYTYGSGWTGNGSGSSSSTVIANNVNLPSGSTDLVISEGVGVKAKIFLQGPYNTSTDAMNTTINEDIPHTSPYSADARTASTKPSTAADWVLVELRDQTTPSTIIASRSAFLNSDGNLIDDDATSGRGIGIAAPPGDYLIAIKHRNHLAVRTSTVQSGLTWGTASSVSNYDFTSGSGQFNGGTAGAVQVDTSPIHWGMIAGDANGNNVVNATDYLTILPQINTSGYAASDVNLNGAVNATDYLIVLPNINKVAQDQ